MLPAPYMEVHYSEAGEILAFWNPMKGDCPFEPILPISLEDFAVVSTATDSYRVRDGKLVQLEREQPKPERPKPADVIVAGLKVNNRVFALEPAALAVMQLDLSRGAKQIRCVMHTPDGDKLQTLPRKEAMEVAEKLADYLAGVYCG